MKARNAHAARARWPVPAWIDLLVLAALSAVPFLWFPNGYLIDGSDTTYPLNAWQWAFGRLFMWDGLENAGANHGNAVGGLIWHALEAGIQALPLSATNAEKLFFVFWLLLSGLSMYAATRLVFRMPILTYVATFIYMFNPVQMTGALWTNASASNISLYAVAPLIFACIILAGERRLRIGALVAITAGLSIIASAVGMAPPLIYALAFEIFVFLLALLLLAPKRIQQQTLYAVGAMLAAFVSTSLFWIYGLANYIATMFSSSAGAGLADFGKQDWLAGISANTSLFVVGRLLGEWPWWSAWNGEPYNYYAAWYLHGVLYIVAGTAIGLGSYWGVRLSRGRRDRRIAVAFAAVAVFSSVFAAGAHPPTGVAYSWFFHHLPGMQVIRSPWYMFEQFAVLAIAILFGYAVHALARRLTFPNARLLVPSGAVIMAALYSWPMFTGAFFLPFRHSVPGFVTQYPTYVTQTAAYLNRSSGRYLIVPENPNGQVYYWSESPYQAGTPPLEYFIYRPFAFLFPGEGAISHNPYDSLLKSTLSDLLMQSPAVDNDLKALGVTQIVVARDAWLDFGGPGALPPVSAWERAVKAIRGAHLSASFGPWSIYDVGPVQATAMSSSYAAGFVAPGDIGAWDYLSASHLPVVDAGTAEYFVARPALNALNGELVATDDVSQSQGWNAYVRAQTEMPSVAFVHAAAVNGTEKKSAARSVTSRFPYFSMLRELATFAQIAPRARDRASWLALPKVDEQSVDDINIDVKQLDEKTSSLILTDNSENVAFTSFSLGTSSAVVIDDRGQVVTESRDGTYGLRLTPGSNIFRVSSPRNTLSPYIFSSRVWRLFGEPVFVPVGVRPTTAGLDVSLKVSPLSLRAYGAQLPLAQDVPLSTMPIANIDIGNQSASLRLALVLNVQGEGFEREIELPIQGSTQIDLRSVIEDRLSKLWNFQRANHAEDVAWLLKNRLPPDVSRARVQRVALAVEKPAGVSAQNGELHVMLRQLTIAESKAYIPSTFPVALKLAPDTARWEGIDSPSGAGAYMSGESVVLPAAPAQTFLDFRRDVHLVVHERYQLDLNNGRHVDAEVTKLTGSQVRLNIAGAPSEVIPLSAISSLKPSLHAGRISVVPSLTGADRRAALMSISFRLPSEQQQAYLHVTFASAPSRAVELNLSNIGENDVALRSSIIPDAILKTPVSLVAARTYGASEPYAPLENQHFLVDLDLLRRMLGLPSDARIESIAVEISAASDGFLLGRLELSGRGSQSNVSGSVGDRTVLAPLAGTAPGTDSDVALPSSQKLDPTLWMVNVPRISHQTLLMFDQSFDPGWRAVQVAHAPSFWDMLLPGELPGKALLHLKVNGYQNGFIVTPATDSSIAIYYSPQRWYLRCLVFSAFAFVICMLLGLGSLRRVSTRGN